MAREVAIFSPMTAVLRRFDSQRPRPYFRSMFRRFREKLERALERREADRPLSRVDVDELLSAMRREVIDLRSRIPRLEKDEAYTALEAARRALSDAESLRNQAAEAREEAERLKAEAADKLEQLKAAERNRSALIARSRRVGTARKLEEMLRGPGGGIRRFERAEEDIETAEDMAAATREVEEALGERQPVQEIETDLELRRLEAARQADEIEKRLADLKQQMEEEGGS
jgi:hypothetical protein